MTPSPKFDPAAWQPEIHLVQYPLDNGLTLLVLPDRASPSSPCKSITRWAPGMSCPASPASRTSSST